MASAASDHLADDFRIHLQQISEDFQRLESRIRALARENADLKSNGKSTLSPVAAGKVVFGGDHLQDSLENQFEEAFGSNYQDKLPTIDTTQISTVAKYQHSKTVSRSNSGLTHRQCTSDMIKRFIIENGPTVVIVLNTIAMGAAIDNDPEHIMWGILELFFAICYDMEFGYKLRMLGWRGYFLGPDCRWNGFDFLCLLLSLVDVILIFLVLIVSQWNFSLGSASIIKVARLARLIRLVRTLHFEVFAELRAIVLGVFSGLRVLFWAIVLLLVLIYVFGIGMATLADSQAEFDTLPDSMFTIFRCFTEGCSAYDGTPLQERLRRTTFYDLGGVWMISYILVFMLVNVGIFNLIMAIFLDNVVSQQTLRKQKELSENALRSQVSIQHAVADLIGQEEGAVALPDDIKSMELSRQNKVMEKVLGQLNLTVTRDRFSTWLDHQKFTNVLEAAGIDTSIRTQLFDILDADSGGLLNVEELISGLMSMRGHVTKGDIIAMSLKVRYVSQLLETLTNAELPRDSRRRKSTLG